MYFINRIKTHTVNYFNLLLWRITNNTIEKNLWSQLMHQIIEQQKDYQIFGSINEQFSQSSQQPSVPLLKKIQKYTTVTDDNFIKSIRHGFSSNIICIYEQRPFTVQFRNTQKFQSSKQCTLLNASLWNNQQLVGNQTYRVYNVGKDLNNIEGQIKVQNVPYDCVEFQEGLWMVSTKLMPVRIYKKSNFENVSCVEDRIVHIGSIYNKKKNSEVYLSPIQMSYNKNNPEYVVGGGRRFLSKYNLQKVMVAEMYNKFDKTNISAVGMLNQNTIVIGTFEGALCMIDQRQNKNISEAQKEKIMLMRPHVDAIMSIALNPANEFIFATNARKDNFTYIWDCRKYNTQSSSLFLSEFIIPKCNNQRISLSFDNDGKILYSGSQCSQVIGWSCQKQTQMEFPVSTSTIKWKVAENSTVNSVLFHSLKKDVIFSTGSRTYSQIIDNEEPDEMPDTKRNENMLCFICQSKKQLMN